MGAIQVFDFDGRAVTAYVFRGRECWLSQDVARVLGYDPNGWSTSWRRWTDGDDAELRAPSDFEVLRGSDLREFLVTAGSAVAEKTRNLTLLYESGLHLVCVKTEKPLGRRLRRFLADVMLPMMKRGAEENRSLREQIIVLSLQAAPTKLDTIWERETIMELCRIYGKPWDGNGSWPLWLKEPLGRIYRIVLGDLVYFELKRRNPNPKRRSLHYQFFTDARHKLTVQDMKNVSLIVSLSFSKAEFFNKLRFHYKRDSLQLEMADAKVLQLPKRGKPAA